MIVKWKAWFITDSGLERFNSDSILFTQLPKDGCLAIQTYHSDKTRTNQLGYDFYFQFTEFNGETHIGCDIAQRERNIESEIYRRYNDVYLVLGRWTTDIIIDQVRSEMREP